MKNSDSEAVRTAFVRSTAISCVVLVSLILGGATLALGDAAQEALRSNQFPPGFREALLVWLAVGPLLGAVSVGTLGFWWGASVVERRVKFLTPLIGVGLLPVLLVPEIWFGLPLEFLIFLAGVTWIFEISLRTVFEELATSPPSWGPLPLWVKNLVNSTRLPLGVVVLAACIYVGITSHLTILDHYRFGTGAYDLGIFDNMMWNALHGQPFRSTVMYGEGPGNSLAGHAEFAMVLFAPLYAISPRAETLLILQSLALGGAAVPLYLLAATRLSRWTAALIAVAYLFYAPVHGAQYYDFHWLPMATPFLFTLFYGLSVGRRRVIIPATALLFLIREDLAPGVAVTSLFLLLLGYRTKLAAWLLAASVAWFALVKFVIMPHFGTWFFADLYKGLMVPGEKGYGSVIKTLLSNPVFALRGTFTEPKLLYLLHIFAPLAFLPLRRPLLLLLTIPGVFFTVLTSWPAAYSLKYHYSTHFTPYVFLGAVLALSSLRSSSPNADEPPPFLSARQRAGLCAVLFASLCHTTQFGLLLRPKSFVGGIQPVAYSLTNEESVRINHLRGLIAKIPADASATATDFEVPHLSNRSKIYAIGQRRDAGQYLLVGPKMFGHVPTRDNIAYLLETYPFGFVASAGEYTLWKQGYVPKDKAAARKARRDLYKLLRHRLPARRP